MTIDQLSCATLVDTGREVNLMRAAMHRKLGSLALRSTSRMFTGLGGQATKPIGKFKARVGMESGVYATEMFVVPDNSMQTDVIIGYELLKSLEVVMHKGKISFKRSPEGGCPVLSADGSGNFHENITPSTVPNLYEETKGTEFESPLVVNRLGIDQIEVPEKYKEQIKNLIAKHHPKKTVETKIETKISLTDTIPIQMSPRRLAPKEKEKSKISLRNGFEKV